MELFAFALPMLFIFHDLEEIIGMRIDNQFVWNIWLGAFIGLTFHFVVHIGQAIVLRKYIPALATSIICLPISIYILKQCFMILTVDIWQMIVGVVVVAVNLLCAHKMTKWRL